MINESSPRRGYDQHLRRWLDLEPYLSSMQVTRLETDWDPDLLPFTESDLNVGPAFRDSDTSYYSLRSVIHSPSPHLTSKPLDPIPHNGTRDRNRRERRFHTGGTAPRGRARGADGHRPVRDAG